MEKRHANEIKLGGQGRLVIPASLVLAMEQRVSASTANRGWNNPGLDPDIQWVR